MYVFRRMSFGEIAQHLNVPEDRATSLVHRARANLARALEAVVTQPDLELVPTTPSPPEAAAKSIATVGDEPSQGAVPT